MRRNFSKLTHATSLFQEVDEDTPDLTVTLTHGGGSVGDDDDKTTTPISGVGSGLDIMSIAEAHREKSKSQQDLKRQFEEFSRNLSFRRTGSDRRNKKKSAGQHLQSCLPPVSAMMVPDVPSAIGEEEADENADEVGSLATSAMVMPGSALGGQDIDFPKGFSMKSRPSI